MEVDSNEEFSGRYCKMGM